MAITSSADITNQLDKLNKKTEELTAKANTFYSTTTHAISGDPQWNTNTHIQYPTITTAPNTNAPFVQTTGYATSGYPTSSVQQAQQMYLSDPEIEVVKEQIKVLDEKLDLIAEKMDLLLDVINYLQLKG